MPGELWPAVALLGFLVLTGVVIALGASSTARYEFERNLVRTGQEAGAAMGRHPAGRRRAPARTAAPAETAAAAAPEAPPAPVAVPGMPAPAPTAGPGVPVPPAATGWWLVEEDEEDPAGDGPPVRVVAGPFPDEVSAEWAVLAEGLEAVAVYGVHRPGRGLALRPSPQERAWLAELGEQLDRLPEDWDELLSDTDPLTTLVVEVTAAVVEAGLPLHDCCGRGAAPSPSGGVCLVPDPVAGGIVVSWRQHDRMSVRQVRGADLDAAVQQTMNDAVADVLAQLGFAVEPFGTTGAHLVTAIQR